MKPHPDYKCSGGFATALIEAWFVADSHNKNAIEHQWPRLFVEDHFSRVQQLAYDLVDEAKKHDLVVTINLEPNEPLAMGNYRHVVDVREARKQT